MFRWEGSATFMILELDSILTDYVRQLSFPCISHFSGHGSYTWPGTFNRSPLGIQYPKLVCTLRKFQEGRRITGPFCWACAQGQYGPGPRACMGLGSRCRTKDNQRNEMLGNHICWEQARKGKILSLKIENFWEFGNFVLLRVIFWWKQTKGVFGA